MKVLISKILENKSVGHRIYRLKAQFTGEIKPGQFFMLKTLDNSFLLPRPISVNDVNEVEESVSFLYRTEGIGTKKISTMIPGNELQLFGPLGNGFDIGEIKGKVAVVGGGIGIAPLLYLTKKLVKNADVYLGFKDFAYMVEEFEKYANETIVITEDGSVGKRGFVTDHIDFSNYDTIVTCGPEIMMNKIIELCNEKRIRCYVSLERRMACGMGVCLGCTVMTKGGNKRACKDGPVFLSDELIKEER